MPKEKAALSKAASCFSLRRPARSVFAELCLYEGSLPFSGGEREVCCRKSVVPFAFPAWNMPRHNNAWFFWGGGGSCLVAGHTALPRNCMLICREGSRWRALENENEIK